MLKDVFTRCVKISVKRCVYKLRNSCVKRCVYKLRNSCAKVFANRSRSKNLKRKNSRGGSPPSRFLGLTCVLEMMKGHVLQRLREQLKVTGSSLEGSDV